MSWRLWGSLFFFASLVVTTACRETVKPNEDRNFPPETFLTAAPIDSIAGGRLSRIPYRYHAHWSGSDRDGAIAGFFVAVTETTFGSRLPPPKPQDYKFTTRTDSVMIFSIFEGRGSDREHGLYVYAVDNQGKVDASPAYVRFVARDRNLPGLDFTEARAEGYYYELVPGGGFLAKPFQRVLTDGVDPVLATTVERDTVPTGSAVYFSWRGFDRDWGGYVVGYGYKLFEPDFIRVDSTVRHIEYGSGVGGATTPVPIGQNVFRVRSVDEAGGTTLGDSIRRFVLNFDPDTWWAGPDTTDPSIQAALLSDDRGRYIPGVGAQGTVPPELDRWLGPGSYDVMPVERVKMRTFVEVASRGTQVRYYIRSDSDTVARNASVLHFFTGGFDKDSPYSVQVPPGGTGPGRVGVPSGPNGSPIAFDYRVYNEYPNGSLIRPNFSRPYPNFDAASPFYSPEIHYISTFIVSGTSYAQTRAWDGNAVGTNSGKDRRIGDPADYVKKYEAGTLPPGQAALRPLITRFFVNYKPYFLPGITAFTPDPDTLVLDQNFTARLYMVDPDSVTQVGQRALFRVRVRILPPGSAATDWAPPSGFAMRSGEQLPFVIPASIPVGRNDFEFELSDQPQDSRGQSNPADSRTITYLIPFYWQVKP
jgi:hypothetical protein